MVLSFRLKRSGVEKSITVSYTDLSTSLEMTGFGIGMTELGVRMTGRDRDDGEGVELTGLGVEIAD